MQNYKHVISHFLLVKLPLTWGQGGMRPLWSAGQADWGSAAT